VLLHHLHVTEPFSSRSWRPSSDLSGKSYGIVLHRIFYLWSGFSFDDVLTESVSSFLAACLGVRNHFIPGHWYIAVRAVTRISRVQDLPGWLLEMALCSCLQQGLEVWGRFFQVLQFEISTFFICCALSLVLFRSPNQFIVLGVQFLVAAITRCGERCCKKRQWWNSCAHRFPPALDQARGHSLFSERSRKLHVDCKLYWTKSWSLNSI